MTEYQIKTRQICFFYLAFLMLPKVFAFPSIMSKIANEDLWISCLFSIIIELLTLCVILSFCIKKECSFNQLLQSVFGKTMTKVIIFFYAIFFVLKSIVPIYEQKDYILLTLFETMPNIIVFIPFFFLSFYLCTKPLRTIGRLSDIFIFSSILGIMILFSLSISNVDFSIFMPIGANGTKTLLGSYTSFIWFGDAIYLAFFMGNFKLQKNDEKKIFISFLIGEILVLLIVVFFYGIFQSIAFRQTYALTEISKYSTIINNIGRFDYVGILLLLFSCSVSLSLPLFFSCRCFETILPVKKNWICPLIVNLIIAIFICSLNQYFISFFNFSKTFLNGFYILMGNIFPIAIIILGRRKYEIN